MHLTRSASFALALACSAAACGPAIAPEEEAGFVDQADTTQGLTPSCTGADVCSGTGTTWASTVRCGASATSRGEVTQLFSVSADRVPQEVRLALRALRRFTFAPGVEPRIHAEIFDVTGQSLPELTGTPLAQGSIGITEVVAGAATTIAFPSAGTLLAGRTYALRFGTDEVASQSLLFGVATFVTDAPWAGEGPTFFATQRRVDAGSTFGDARQRPLTTPDVAFALVAPLAFAPAIELRDGDAQGEPVVAAVTFADTHTGNTSAARTVKLANTGNVPLTFGSPAFTAPAPFVIGTTTCGATLPTGGTCTVQLAFAPTATGAASGTFSASITAESTSVPATLALSGNGLQGACTLPWGGSIANHQSVTAYLTASPAAGTPCTPEQRTCTDGALSGSYTAQACTATLNVAQFSGYRAWSDGSLAASCNAYRTGDATHAWSGATGDAIYRVQLASGATNVWCDMTTDNGGWMLTLYAPSVGDTTFDLTLQQIAVRGYALKTVTANASTRPVLPNGLTNGFNQVLFKGGNTTWHGQMGTWIRFSTFAQATSVSVTYSGVLTSSGVTAAYHTDRGWQSGTIGIGSPFGLWDDAGISNICGGANNPGGRNCPYFGWAQASYSWHYDTSSARELYVR